jgi:ribonuclease Z
MAQYNLEPRKGLSYLNRSAFDHTNLNLPAIKEIEENQEYLHAVKLARIDASKVDLNSESFAGEDVEIITLGTGSSIPAKYRNGRSSSYASLMMLYLF